MSLVQTKATPSFLILTKLYRYQTGWKKQHRLLNWFHQIHIRLFCTTYKCIYTVRYLCFIIRDLTFCLKQPKPVKKSEPGNACTIILQVWERINFCRFISKFVFFMIADVTFQRTKDILQWYIYILTNEF